MQCGPCFHRKPNDIHHYSTLQIVNDHDALVNTVINSYLTLLKQYLSVVVFINEDYWCLMSNNEDYIFLEFLFFPGQF